MDEKLRGNRMSVEVTKDSHEVIDAVYLRLSADAATEVANLLAGVPVSYSTSTFDEIADGIYQELNYEGYDPFMVNEEGEYGPFAYGGHATGCGCGAPPGEDEEFSAELDQALSGL